MTTPKVAEPLIPVEKTPAEMLEFKRRYIETADRSYINARLEVKLPPHLHGEWHGTDPFSQMIARSKGFVSGEAFLTEENIMHNTPGGGVIGDVMFMVMSKQEYEAKKEIDSLNARRKAGFDRDVDEEYKEHARSLGLDVAKDMTTTRVLEGSDVNNALKG